MAAEVGLLTRNIKFCSDLNQGALHGEMFGSRILVGEMSNSDTSSIGQKTSAFLFQFYPKHIAVRRPGRHSKLRALSI